MENLIKEFDKLVLSAQDARIPKWLKDLQMSGLSAFNKRGIPTVKDEEWKYTNLAPLKTNTFDLPTAYTIGKNTTFENYCDSDDLNMVFVNGQFSSDLSNCTKAPDGITVSTVSEAIADNPDQIRELLQKYSNTDEAPFIGLNQALAGDAGAYIRVAQSATHKGVIHIIHVTNGQNIIYAPRTLIVLAQSSEITVLETHIAFDDELTYFSNALTDVFLEENATVHYCKAQKESTDAFHIGHTRIWQEANSNFDGFTLNAGGKLTRNNLDIVLNGEGADAILHSLYSAYGNQHVDNHTSVDHRVPNCTSNQLYKGILNENARAVFNGKVFVRPIAQQTNSYQLNKNLLLGNSCRVDTKPQLEISADDVRCTHGATISQLDKDEMFYLQTRCIPQNIATRMLVHGFVNELFDTIKNEHIHDKVNKLMEPSFRVLG